MNQRTGVVEYVVVTTTGKTHESVFRTDTEPHLVDYIERSAADDRRLRSRAVRVLSIVASVVTLLALIASGASVIALRKQHEAETQAQQALDAHIYAC